MSDQYPIKCGCGEVELSLSGKPRVKGFCHCNDCRELLDIPFHSVTAWNEEQVKVVRGEESLSSYQHPTLEMKRIFCSNCGETLYNTNAMNWRVISQLLISKSNNNRLPDELQSDSHFFYGSRIVNIDDDLPKHD